jgi:PII-like signaling protein
MRTETQAHRLRIFVNESDRVESRAVYEAIIRAAREQGLAGATAFRAIEGFGGNGRVHSVKVLHLSGDVPIIVEIVDKPERIAAFLPTVDKLVAEGALTIEQVRLVTYRRDESQAGAYELDDEIPLDAEQPEFTATSTQKSGILTDSARNVIESAKESATSSHRVYADSVDVLLVLLCESKGLAARALKNLGVDCKIVERTLRETVSRDENAAAYIDALQQKASAEAKWLAHNDVSTEHLLFALCQIRPSAASDILMRLGAQPRDVCKELLTILDHEEDWQAWLADHPEM